METKEKEEDLFHEPSQEELPFEVSKDVEIMPHVLKEYSTEQIRDMYDMYMKHTEGTKMKNDLRVGNVIHGKIVSQTEDEFLVDIGYKDYVSVEKRKEEVSIISEEYADDNNQIDVNTEVEVMITEVSENPYQIKGSVSEIAKGDVYDEMKEDENLVIQGKVVDWNSAGFNVNVYYDEFTIPAFMPNTLAGINKLTEEQSEALIGETINLMVESYADEKGTFIVSRKKYLKTLIPETIENLKIRDEQGNPIQYDGEITGTTDFGIFVEFKGCLTGMIHKANLGDETKEKFKMLKQGDKINFYVKEVVKQKLHLTQIWRETLWDKIDVGHEYEATIKEHKSFGALVTLDEETMGLIHTNELNKANKSYNEGDKVKVKVVTVQRDDRRIYLSIVE